jgi:hypothetical protein
MRPTFCSMILMTSTLRRLREFGRQQNRARRTTALATPNGSENTNNSLRAAARPHSRSQSDKAKARIENPKCSALSSILQVLEDLGCTEHCDQQREHDCHCRCEPRRRAEEMSSHVRVECSIAGLPDVDGPAAPLDRQAAVHIQECHDRVALCRCRIRSGRHQFEDIELRKGARPRPAGQLGHRGPRAECGQHRLRVEGRA